MLPRYPGKVNPRFTGFASRVIDLYYAVKDGGLGIGMVLIALGSGGVTPAASSMVGALYEDEAWRPLRDAGFSIFYISINIGGFLGPLLTGLVQTRLDFY